MNQDHSGMRSGRFTLLQGGKGMPEELEGPITRMNLWSRSRPVSARLVTFAICAKVALLASILYFIFGK